MYPILVEDEDPIPMYAQKLLVMLLDLKCIKVADILQLKLVSQFFDVLLGDLLSINFHNKQLCLFLASSPKVDTTMLLSIKVVGHVGALLDFAYVKACRIFSTLFFQSVDSFLSEMLATAKNSTVVRN
jgi:serine/threonine-protein kinase ULK4